ncbi:unnamed protein product [Anisakis simplex]|uniref:SoxZ domain-containing protein n=1 Tax=Anisakis simplex TaxID=6269 RepID=A0A0M3J6E5_ANISI|nr:unnamed protein product [Anisakis simplex]
MYNNRENITSESFSSADTSLPLNDAEIRLNVSVSQLEKRGKMKHTEIETFLTIHRKSLSKEEYVIVHRSPKLMKVSVTSLQKFPEIVIPREKLLGGANDRLLRFSLRNAANGATIGEAEVYYSQLINDGKISLKVISSKYDHLLF